MHILVKRKNVRNTRKVPPISFHASVPLIIMCVTIQNYLATHCIIVLMGLKFALPFGDLYGNMPQRKTEMVEVGAKLVK